MSPVAICLICLIIAGLALPLMGLLEAPPPAFLILVAVFCVFGHGGTRATKRGALGHELFKRSRELGLCLLPGLVLWSVVWGNVFEGALEFDGRMTFAAMEARLHLLDSGFEWLERARSAELIVAAVVLVLAILGKAVSLRPRLIGGAKKLFPWLTRLSHIWIGVTAFTVLGPIAAATSSLGPPRVELARHRDELVRDARTVARGAVRSALKEAVEAAASSPAIQQPLAAIDADVQALDDCGRLKRQVDSDGKRECPVPHDWASWRERSEHALAAVGEPRDLEEALSRRAIERLPYDAIEERARSNEPEGPTVDQARPPSEQVEYVVEQLVDGLYEHGPKEALTAAIPGLDGASEWALIAPFVDVLLNDSVKDRISRALEEIVDNYGDKATAVAGRLRSALASMTGAPHPPLVADAQAAALAQARAPDARAYVATLKKKEKVAAAKEKAAAAKERIAAARRERLQLKIGELSRELHDARVFIRGDLKGGVRERALDFVPPEHLLRRRARAPGDALVIDADGLSEGQLVAELREKAPATFRAETKLQETVFESDRPLMRPSVFVADPDKTISNYGADELNSWSTPGPNPFIDLPGHRAGASPPIPKEWFEKLPHDPSFARPPELPHYEPHFEPHVEVPHFVP